MKLINSSHNYAKYLLISVCCLQLAINALQAQKNNGIQQSKKYPHYFSYQGKEILLLGGSNEDNLFQMPEVERHLDVLKDCGGNYVRCTMSSRDKGNDWAFFYVDSLNRYDLRKFNPEYWKRFDHFLLETAKRGIIVQIEIWATFDFYRKPWQNNPFNPKNNLNYSSEISGIAEDIPTHPTRTDNNFFRTTPEDCHVNYRVLTYQQKFVDKLLSYTLNYDHILYCMDNETSVSALWGKFWAHYIAEKALEKDKKILCTEMWDPWDLNHAAHRESFFHPETYGFVEVSQNNHHKGEKHWQQGIYQLERLKQHNCLRPVTNIKIYGSDQGRHGGSEKDAIEKFVRNVFMGCASARFHRPSSGIGLSSNAQKIIQGIREVSQYVFIPATSPANDLLQGRGTNEAYCIRQQNEAFLVYFPDPGEVAIQLPKNISYKIRWLSLLEAHWAPEEESIQPLQKLKSQGIHKIAYIYLSP